MEDRLLTGGQFEDSAAAETVDSQARSPLDGDRTAGAGTGPGTGPEVSDSSVACDARASLTQRVEHAGAGVEPAGNSSAPTQDTSASGTGSADEPIRMPRLTSSAKGRRLVRKTDATQQSFSPEQRLLLLDTWRRSGLPAGDFAALVGVSKHTLYGWHRRFLAEGPAGLVEQPRGGPKGSQLPDLTQRTILMLKASHPDWGCERISDMLWRGPALPASPSAVARVLHQAGYELEETPTRPHPPTVRRFERARPNELWQTDLFSFMLKRQNRRVYLVAFLDDHSRFITSYGLHATQSAPLVIEVLRAGIDSYGTPQEILNDNGAQYVTWRGKSAFTKELEKRGIRQVVARPRRPQTLGKIERFWGTLWRELLETAVFLDLHDARRRIGWFMDHYNFQRTNQGIDGLVPADRFFGAAPEVLRTLEARVAENALELARGGVPKQPFYLTGQVGGKSFSIHAAGERVILSDAHGVQQEIDLDAPAPPRPTTDPERPASHDGSAIPASTASTPAASSDLAPPICPDGSLPEGLTSTSSTEPPLPGASPLDEALRRLHASPEQRPGTEGGAP